MLRILILSSLLFSSKLLITSLNTGNELKCYQCNSLTMPHCSDFFDNRTVLLLPCPNDGKNYTRCLKLIQEMYIDGVWERRYFRDCAEHGDIGWEEGRWCYNRVGTYRVLMRYCYCNNKEGCNFATGFSYSLPFIATSLILSLIHGFFF